jgi:hypothetical protein
MFSRRLFFFALAAIVVQLNFAYYIHLARPDGTTIDTNNDSFDHHPNYDEILIALQNSRDAYYGPYGRYKESYSALTKSIGKATNVPIHPYWRIGCSHVIKNPTNLNYLWYYDINSAGIKYWPKDKYRYDLDICLLPCNSGFLGPSIVKIDGDLQQGKLMQIPSSALHNAAGVVHCNAKGRNRPLKEGFVGIAKLTLAESSPIISAPFIANTNVKVTAHGGDSGSFVYSSTGQNAGPLSEQFKLFGVMHGPAGPNAKMVWLGHPDVYSWIRDTINAAGKGPTFPEKPIGPWNDIVLETHYALADPNWAIAAIRKDDESSRKWFLEYANSNKVFNLSESDTQQTLYLRKITTARKHYEAVHRSRDINAQTHVGVYQLSRELNDKVDHIILLDSLTEPHYELTSIQIDPNVELCYVPKDQFDEFEEIAFKQRVKDIDQSVSATAENSEAYLIYKYNVQPDPSKPFSQRSRDENHGTQVGAFILDENLNSQIDHRTLWQSLTEGG